MKSRVPLVVWAVIVLVILSGCFSPLGEGFTDAFSFVFDSESYEYDATLDFGPVDPGGQPAVFAGTIINTFASEIEVTAIDSDNEAYSVDAPSLPGSIPPGDSVDVSLSFLPTGSGESNGVLSVSIEGTEFQFVLNLAGQGNYPPSARATVTIENGPVAEGINGSYFRTEEIQNGLPVYRLPGTDFVIYGSDEEGIIWRLDNDFDTFEAYYDVYNNNPVGPGGSNEDWFPGSLGSGPAPSSVGEIISSGFDFYQLSQDDVISPNYTFTDEDGDSEGATLFQWYRSDSTFDPYSTYSEIVGQTSSTYTITPSDGNYYFKVLVTPVAAAGITPGEPVLIGPSPIANVP